MPTTYIDLTNRVLRRLNETQISVSDFPSVTGIHAAAKDSVLDAIRQINTTKIDWPFNAVEHTQVLVVGTEEYAWQSDFTAADWDSFQIQRDDTLSILNRTLKPLARDQWYKRFRDQDYDTTTTGKSQPVFIFPSHGQGFGLTPSPERAYTLKYRYYKNPTDLDLYTDQTTIPSKFDYVIVAGALYHMDLLKENAESSDRAEKRFNEGIKNMVNVFLPNATNAYDTRVAFGGGMGSGMRMWTGY